MHLTRTLTLFVFMLNRGENVAKTVGATSSEKL